MPIVKKKKEKNSFTDIDAWRGDTCISDPTVNWFSRWKFCLLPKQNKLN